MDIDTLHARRRAHLQRLIRERFGGNQSAFARAVERCAGEISRWLKAPHEDIRWARNMSEVSARRIEEYLGLPMGYLDRPLHDRPSGEGVGEPDAVYRLSPENNALTPFIHSPEPCFSARCCHGEPETQCRHCALVSQVAHRLNDLSYEEVRKVSKLIDVLYCQE